MPKEPIAHHIQMKFNGREVPGMLCLHFLIYLALNKSLYNFLVITFIYHKFVLVLIGSPWRVDIRSAAHISASGRGLQMVPARVPASFDVQTGGTGQDGSLVTTVLCKCYRNAILQGIP